MTSRPRYLRIALTVAAVVSGATLFLSGYWVGSASGNATEPVASESRAVPDWFLDIADYYDRNPRVTPEFDFALLYDSRPSGYGMRRALKEGSRMNQASRGRSDHRPVDTRGRGNE